jgi:hypothetical protein
MRPLIWLVLGTSALKLAFEGWNLLHARNKRQSVMKRMASLMLGDLRNATKLRFALTAVGGLVFPLVLAQQLFAGAASGAVVIGILALLLGGELTERYLFFRAAPGSRMPGGLR